ncbi:MAG: pyridoxine 5'-phosphate synthase [Bacteroidota bacterium]|nr:pyridoxine 5'-phosphate synthase [Candidatus Kapabacteria bacterium]MCS7302403.1 pyridoxine 5'-phosphate synthase [Candidatus Kapabacteria bacterium]MCX7937123.1 pyridoxine 5'-phosphate synthase [Chlorobiota bacterium]MDW8074616.1 pyridoxine 5'-phosphate synthase [Bacteroidota bacterium]MDW8270908.1 pyridoxine 5'-phosphate synthase [Bacteroidota bacterium]
MAELAVNVDHIATIREARGGIEPDPVAGAVIAELAGAVGIVCHLREDRRHINDRDLRLLREVVKTKLDLEMAATPEIIRIALDTLPDLVTIVPERREELTTEGGLDVAARVEFYADLVEQMHEKDIEVSFFIEPDHRQIDAALQAGADIVELHTGHYANARTPHEVRYELEKLATAASYAHTNGLRVTAGHGLNYINVTPIVRIPQIVEVSIGHAIIARAVFVGLDRAVREMCALVRHGTTS